MLANQLILDNRLMLANQLILVPTYWNLNATDFEYKSAYYAYFKVVKIATVTTYFIYII